jgi:hypothetical protein
VNDVYVDQIPDARKLSELSAWIDETCASCDEVRLVFHNGIDFDFHWFNQVLGIDLLNNPKVVPRDTYVLSRLAFPMRPGGHSVEAWGTKFGIMKTEIDDNQWAEFSPIMVERCRNDVLIQEKIYKELREKELRGFSVESVDLEHRAQIHISQQRKPNGTTSILNTKLLNGLFLNLDFCANIHQGELKMDNGRCGLLDKSWIQALLAVTSLAFILSLLISIPLHNG